MIRSFLVNADGSVSGQEEKPVAQSRKPKSSEIIKNLKAGNTSPAEALRLVAIEIARLAIDMSKCRSEAERQACNRKLRALVALSKSISKLPDSKERDVLNIDRPKFQYVYRKMVASAEKAARDALGKGSETTVQQIMKSFNAELAARMPEFRRTLEQMDLSTGTNASKSEEGKNGSEPSE